MAITIKRGTLAEINATSIVDGQILYTTDQGLNNKQFADIGTGVSGTREVISGRDSADEISYDNTTSGLVATDVQDAIDEVYDVINDKITSTSGVVMYQKIVKPSLTFSSGVATYDVSSFTDSKSLSGIAFAVPESTSTVFITGCTTNGTDTITVRGASTSGVYSGTIIVNLMFFLYE